MTFRAVQQNSGIYAAFPGELRISSVSSLQDGLLVESVRRHGLLCRLYPNAKASQGLTVLAQKLAAECGGDAAGFADGAERSTKAVEEP